MHEQNPGLDALSPLDGRYRHDMVGLAPVFSEAGLIRARIQVEAHWLLALSEDPVVQNDLKLTPSLKKVLEKLSQDVPADAPARVKAIEATTRHDVKAVEYWLREELSQKGADERVLAFIHFACTSEDINNTAYALMLKEARDRVLAPAFEEVMTRLVVLSKAHQATPMLSRTHGQTASPTTLGKEVAVFGARLRKAWNRLMAVPLSAKMNGAVGAYNAHALAYPEVDWIAFSKCFLSRIGLDANVFSTQIEPHDDLAAFCDSLRSVLTILLDFSRDAWGYVSLGYFRQKAKAGEVGSSTMPHKVNPIDFENAEGNIGMARALAMHFSEKLPVSRFQRDLSDSTVMRNLGVVLGHGLLALRSITRGLDRIDVDSARLKEDLEAAPEVLTEAVQTVLRRAGVADAYERLKTLSRGQVLTMRAYQDFVSGLSEISEAEKRRLMDLTPSSYVGLAREIAQIFIDQEKKA